VRFIGRKRKLPVSSHKTKRYQGSTEKQNWRRKTRFAKARFLPSDTEEAKKTRELIGVSKRMTNIRKKIKFTDAHSFPFRLQESESTEMQSMKHLDSRF
jgi:hypothetical protein